MTYTLSYISSQAFINETARVSELSAPLSSLRQSRRTIEEKATALASYARTHTDKGGIENFLQEYGLNTREGVALMCLAEALLRIPDNETANALIRDKLSDADWEGKLGASDSLFINATSWGLMLTGGVVAFGNTKQDSPASVFRSLVKRCGEPLIREALKAAMRIIGTQFVLGETIEEALARSHDGSARKYRFSFDMLGEGARNQAQAEAYFKAYSHAISTLAAEEDKGRPWQENLSISIKLSGLHPRFQWTQKERVLRELVPRVLELIKQSAAAGISVSIDAEESSRLDITLEVFSALYSDPSLSRYDGLGYVLQAYQKRAVFVIDYLAELASRQRKRMPVRLVKGAYWDAEIKAAQQLGLAGYPVFTRKEHTDISYLACAQKILSYGDCFYPQFATHNALTVATLMEMSKDRVFEFQRLHGMGEALYAKVTETYPCRVYAPVGKQESLLAYLIRRLLENGANTSFVHQLMDKEISLAEMLADPLERTLSHQGLANPNIPLPEDLYRPDRANSIGVDMGNAHALAVMDSAVERHRVIPLFPVLEGVHDYDALFRRARLAYEPWSKAEVHKRAELMEKAAELVNLHAPAFIDLLQREAGKVLADAVAEVREAQDFLHYYAARARELFAPQLLKGSTGEHNHFSVSGRGVFVCISPWNFPLAIFTGQIAAALVTGNAVLAKPAEQTPRIAARMVELLHEAGISADVLQLVQGGGGVGAALVAHKDTAGVVFTGSTDVAKSIAASLTAKPGALVPLIAETGGQNCMIVDSSALIEQTVDDIVASAFLSAGQRCSALRVLYVQQEIADELISVLCGAIQELKLGDPTQLSTDIGPVIDAEAKTMLSAHVTHMTKEAKLLGCTPLPEGLSGHFIAPHVFEIRSVQVLEREVFGPILHIVRFDMNKLDAVIDEINATGYGLTFGIQSRIQDRIDHIASRIHAGNIYVNRSMTGAVVGVQPFGGEGLSGTGPKAGGPYYLHRFVKEVHVTTNTAAIGGNLELLS